MLEQGLVLLIGGDTAVKSLIGLRLFAVVPPPEETQFPYLTYQTVSDVPEYTIDKKQYGRRRMQFDAFGTSYADTKNVLRALRNVLDTFQGTLNDPDSTLILSSIRIMSIDNFESDSRTYRSMTEYEIQYRES